MGAISGRSAAVLMSTVDVSGFLNDSTASESVGANQNTTYGADGHTYSVGLSDGSVSLSGVFDNKLTGVGGATADGLDVVARAIAQVNDVPVSRAVGRTRGAGCQFGLGTRMTHEVSGSPDGIVEASVEVQVDEGISFGRTLTAGVETLSDATNLASIDFGTGRDNGGSAILHVTANASTDTITVAVEHSDDGSTWVNRATFTVIASATLAAQVVRWDGVTERYMRVAIVESGTGDYDLFVAAAACGQAT